MCHNHGTSTHATSASAARLHANQQNAQHSTGPRTPEGKAASSQNSTKHGFACSDDALARQQPAAFQTLVDEYAKQYAPKDQVMHDLLHQLASARLRQDRAAQLENLALQNEPTLDQLALLTKLERYRKSAEASYHRALKQLQAIDAQYKALAAQAIRNERARQAIAYGIEAGRQHQKDAAARQAELMEVLRTRENAAENSLEREEEKEEAKCVNSR